MSLTQTQIVKQYELEIGANRGDVANNPISLEDFVDQENIAFSDYLTLAFNTAGTWKFDDSNHSDFPEITTNIVAGQRDYTFTTDETGNLILDIYKVYAKETGKDYQELENIDADTTGVVNTITTGSTITGVPYSYDKTANVIRLEVTPAENVTDGLKVSINREATLFTVDDTTKKPGIPGLHHKWFYLLPALDYARRSSLSSFEKIKQEVIELEADVKKYFSRRERDRQDVLSPEPINSI
jgi:hypothetical protein